MEGYRTGEMSYKRKTLLEEEIYQEQNAVEGRQSEGVDEG